ncbi:hypothetical protein X992_6280 [Burkholderia pseudomallei MSHR5492]|nr:hypothetical protein X992_6280 [Burkholderia pseudomallei MSHR5492]
MQAAIDQLPCMDGAFSVILDGIHAYPVTPERMGRFRDGDAFAGAWIEDAHRPRGGGQCQEHAFERAFVGWKVAVLDEIARKARKHQSHGETPEQKER